jgi:hypothetical protein
MTWEDHWGAIHEAAHAVVARYFGLTVHLVTMNAVYIEHCPYAAPDDDNSMECLIVYAAGDAATTCFLQWTGTGLADDQLSWKRLRGLGAGRWKARRLMRAARLESEHRVQALRDEIRLVADALRQRRVMSQRQIDALLMRGRDRTGP